MQNSIILRVFLLGAFAIMGIIAMQTYWVISTWNINEEEFDKKVRLALYNVAKSLADLNNGELPARDVIKQKTSNYYIVNIANEFNAPDLEHYLHIQFQERMLNIDFEYAVYDCTTNEMLYGNYCSYNPDMTFETCFQDTIEAIFLVSPSLPPSSILFHHNISHSI